MSQDNPHGQSGPSPLPFFLTFFGLAGALLFLVLISGGLFFYVFLGFLLIGLVGTLHYFLWGQSLHAWTEGEREEQRLRDEAEADPW